MQEIFVRFWETGSEMIRLDLLSTSFWRKRHSYFMTPIDTFVSKNVATKERRRVIMLRDSNLGIIVVQPTATLNHLGLNRTCSVLRISKIIMCVEYIYTYWLYPFGSSKKLKLPAGGA